MSLIPFAGAVQKFNRSAGPAYQIERSLRFNSADSAYLNRTPSSTGNRRTFTFSFWVKRSTLGTTQRLFASQDNGGTSANILALQWNATTDYFQVYEYSSAYRLRLVTSQVFRDVGAWYHIVLAIDTTQATNTDRAKLYVNGSQVTAFSTATYPAQNTDLFWNVASQACFIGRWFDGGTALGYTNGYLTEINFIDGYPTVGGTTYDATSWAALDVSTLFGEYNSTTGVWQPKAYTGTYGTNGFYLNFSDNSGTTSTTLGKDSSGNGNNWTPNNFSVTAGAGNDSLVDTPTPYGDDTGVGGEVRGNYCTWNSAAQSTVANGTVTRSNGNLDSTDGGTTYSLASFGTISVTSGKWYWEITVTAASGSSGAIGIIDTAKKLIGGTASDAHFGFTYGMNGNKTDGRTYGGTVFSTVGVTAYGATYTTNDVLGVAMDLDEGTLTFYKNGVSQGVAFTGISGQFTPAVGDGANATSYTWTLNAGQRPFAYTAPSGFKALCTQNLPGPTIKDGGQYFNTVLYTGNGSTQSITGVGFQPDLVWLKSRSNANDNNLYDVVRGISGTGSPTLLSNLTDAETTYTGFGVSSLNSDGFTVIGNGGLSNASGLTYVGWNWKANGAGVENTDGTITSTVSANPDSGFSIVTYTSGTNVAATVGHGLGIAPSMIILKFRDAVSAWSVYHASVGNTRRLTLNTTDAQSATDITFWNNTSPTSTVFSVGTSFNQSTSYSYVAYCFAAIPGYSAFGSYTGNGSAAGPFVYTGFRPAFVMVKRTDSTGSWIIHDTSRDIYNLTSKDLYANLSDAETIASGTDRYDFLANGFKLRATTTNVNASGGTFIYMAFAENPFKYSLAR